MEDNESKDSNYYLGLGGRVLCVVLHLMIRINYETFVFLYFGF